MKKHFCCSLIFAMVTILATAQQAAKVTASGIGYLEYLPNGYHSNTNKYPVVISLHGIREKGTSSTDPARVMEDLPRVAHVGLPKYVKQGKKYPFILISPQLKNSHGSWPPSYVMEVLNHVKRSLRIDEKRIYLTGLSLGGLGVWKTAGAYPEIFAAIAPICPGGNALDQASVIAAENVAAWGFHGQADKIVSYTVTTKMIEAMNASPKKPNPPAKVTLFPGMGHIIWDKAYHETNVLDWMLGFRKGGSGSPPAPPANKPPVVNAGPDKTLTLPSNAVYIDGTVSDPDGKIVSQRWTQTNGAGAGMSSTESTKVRAYDLREGTYVFRLTATDNDGASAFSEVKVIVKASANKAPSVNAGADETLTLPQNTTTLQGSAQDYEGEIASYHWTKVAGGNADISGAGSPTANISNLTEGAYVFRLTVKDSDGASAFDEVKVLVKSPENQPPAVFAGADMTVTLPVQSVAITGRAEDADGDVVSYTWTKLSGGAAELGGVNTAVLTVSGLQPGKYEFRLTAADDDGASDFDDATIVVTASSEENDLRDDEVIADKQDESPANDAPPIVIKRPRKPRTLQGPVTQRTSRSLRNRVDRPMNEDRIFPVRPIR